MVRSKRQARDRRARNHLIADTYSFRGVGIVLYSMIVAILGRWVASCVEVEGWGEGMNTRGGVVMNIESAATHTVGGAGHTEHREEPSAEPHHE